MMRRFQVRSGRSVFPLYFGGGAKHTHIEIDDVVLLQELKGTEFPADLIKALGYECATVTQKTYNGVGAPSQVKVAIASPLPRSAFLVTNPPSNGTSR